MTRKLMVKLTIGLAITVIYPTTNY